jgi:hypothetical protein
MTSIFAVVERLRAHRSARARREQSRRDAEFDDTSDAATDSPAAETGPGGARQSSGTPRRSARDVPPRRPAARGAGTVLHGRLTAVAAAASFCAALVIVQATPAAPDARVSATTETRGTLVPNADHLLISHTPTPVPAPAPMPVPAPAPIPVPVVQGAESAPVVAPAPRVIGRLPVPVVRRNWLTSGDGTLSTGVGVYSDCTGGTELTHASAAVDTCIAGPRYFVGHNAGVFTPLMHMGVGSTITYYDGNGVAHVWRVVSVRPNWRSTDGVPPATQSDVVAQFQTCAVPDGSIDRILDVVPA